MKRLGGGLFGWTVVCRARASSGATGRVSLGHLLSEDSAAARAGVAAGSVANADVVYLFAVVGGTQALIGIVLVAAAVVAPAWRTVAVGLEAARCAVTLGVGVAKLSTADALVGGVPDVAQRVLASLLLAVLLLRRQPRTVNVTGSARSSLQT